MLAELLGRLARALDGAGVQYMVIGGQAVLIYGEPRATRDVDVTVALEPSGLPALLEVARDAHLSVIVDDPERFVGDTMVLPVNDDATGWRVDFILSMTSYERDAISRAREVQMGGTAVRFATPEDVVIHKIFAGRPRDIEDVRSILAKQRDIDRSYVEEWLSHFDRDLPGKDYAKVFHELLRSI